MDFGNRDDAKRLLGLANNHNYLILKLADINRDYDVYCSRQFTHDFRESLTRNEIEFLELDYGYVVRLFVFSNYNVAIDLIVEPRIRNRVYTFENLSYALYNDYVAKDEQNQLWKKFQNNEKSGRGLSSKVTLKSTWEYILILFRIQFLCCGFTFSGPDGSGKSSTIERVGVALNVMKVPYRLRRQVFGVFPRPAELLGRKPNLELENSNPNGGIQKGLILSFVATLYYIFDYLFGIFLWLFRVNKYEVLLFDRYVMDFVVNIERNALHKSFSIVFKFFMRILSNGFRHYFCFAPPDVINARKNELDTETIGKLNNDYLNLDLEWYVWKCW